MDSFSEPLFTSLETLNLQLLHQGCNRCSLSQQKGLNGCCISRGTLYADKMIVAEAPAEEEDAVRKPLVGPAGRLLDKIWASVGMSTDDWYCTNITLCRHIAPPGSGRKNLPATDEMKKACRPYLDQQIDLCSPKIIVTLGKPATEAILNKKIGRMGDYRGKLVEGKKYLVYPMWHPAYLIHSQRDPQRHLQARKTMWDDVRQLKHIIEERL